MEYRIEKRENKFYIGKECVASECDGKIVIDELAFGPALLDNTIPAGFIKTQMIRQGFISIP